MIICKYFWSCVVCTCYICCKISIWSSWDPRLSLICLGGNGSRSINPSYLSFSIFRVHVFPRSVDIRGPLQHDAKHAVAFEILKRLSDIRELTFFVLSLCSPQTLNKNNLLPPDESCNFFPSALPQTNVYATTYYPSPLGKYDFPSMDPPCSYMHSWCTNTHIMLS